MSGWFWRRLGRGNGPRDVETELSFHLEMRAREFEASGLSREEALRAAESSFGDVDENDPASVARWMKKVGGAMGEDLGDDFDQAVEDGLAGGATGGDDPDPAE